MSREIVLDKGKSMRTLVSNFLAANNRFRGCIRINREQQQRTKEFISTILSCSLPRHSFQQFSCPIYFLSIAVSQSCSLNWVFFAGRDRACYVMSRGPSTPQEGEAFIKILQEQLASARATVKASAAALATERSQHSIETATRRATEQQVENLEAQVVAATAKVALNSGQDATTGAANAEDAAETARLARVYQDLQDGYNFVYGELCKHYAEKDAGTPNQEISGLEAALRELNNNYTVPMNNARDAQLAHANSRTARQRARARRYRDQRDRAESELSYKNRARVDLDEQPETDLKEAKDMRAAFEAAIDAAARDLREVEANVTATAMEVDSIDVDSDYEEEANQPRRLRPFAQLITSFHDAVNSNLEKIITLQSAAEKLEGVPEEEKTVQEATRLKDELRQLKATTAEDRRLLAVAHAQTILLEREVVALKGELRLSSAQIARLQKRLTDVEKTIDDPQRIANLEAQIEIYKTQSKAAAKESNLRNQQIQTLNDELNDKYAGAGVLGGPTDQAGKITELEKQVTELQSEIVSCGQLIASHTAVITTLRRAITNGGGNGALAARVAQLQDQVTTLQNQNTALINQDNTDRANNSGLTSQNAQHELDIKTLEGNITNLEADILTRDGQITKLQTDYGSLETEKIQNTNALVSARNDLTQAEGIRDQIQLTNDQNVGKIQDLRDDLLQAIDGQTKSAESFVIAAKNTEITALKAEMGQLLLQVGNSQGSDAGAIAIAAKDTEIAALQTERTQFIHQLATVRSAHAPLAANDRILRAQLTNLEANIRHLNQQIVTCKHLSPFQILDSPAMSPQCLRKRNANICLHSEYRDTSAAEEA
jgi:hypothetical protein